MEYLYLSLAGAVFASHLLFVLLYPLSTALFCLGRYRSRSFLQQAHVMCVFIMAAGQLVLLECPLVTLERAFRNAAGSPLWYEDSFVVFVVEQATSLHLPVVLVSALSILLITLTLAALLWQRTAALQARRHGIIA